MQCLFAFIQSAHLPALIGHSMSTLGKIRVKEELQLQAQFESDQRFGSSDARYMVNIHSRLRKYWEIVIVTTLLWTAFVFPLTLGNFDVQILDGLLTSICSILQRKKWAQRCLDDCRRFVWD
jgi:hypothetical protein